MTEKSESGDISQGEVMTESGEILRESDEGAGAGFTSGNEKTMSERSVHTGTKSGETLNPRGNDKSGNGAEHVTGSSEIDVAGEIKKSPDTPKSDDIAAQMADIEAALIAEADAISSAKSLRSADEENADTTQSDKASEKVTSSPDGSAAAKGDIPKNSVAGGQVIPRDKSSDAKSGKKARKHAQIKLPRIKISRKTAVTCGIAAAAAVFVLLCVWLGVSLHYKDRFLMKTTVNKFDFSGLTVSEAEKIMQSQVEKYVLTITGKDGATEQIHGRDINIKYTGSERLKKALEKQNPYIWPKALFGGSHIAAEMLSAYDANKLDDVIAASDFLKDEGKTAAVSATVVLNEGSFVIQDEAEGTQVDREKFFKAVKRSVETISSELDLKEADCYVEPAFTSESPEVISARDRMNDFLNAEIIYNYNGNTVKLDSDTFAPWISADASMTPVVSAEMVKDYVSKTLAGAFNTPDRDGVFTSQTPGKQVGFKSASLGRLINTEAETEAIIKTISEGKSVIKEPAIAREEMPEGQYVWGNTYLEVDLTEQEMWYVVNGAPVFNSCVVTGVQTAAKETPAGLFTILEMKRNKIMRGYLPNGQLEYETPAKWWMRVTWSGIGFHDANWNPNYAYTKTQNAQSENSRKQYHVRNGSHGCINMPPAKAEQLYGLIQVGTPVVIHY